MIDKTIWIFLFLFTILSAGLIYFMFDMANTVDNNPCLACAKLTGYVCINKTDVPLGWFADGEWNDIHNKKYVFGDS